jgi:hypothetical protein
VVLSLSFTFKKEKKGKFLLCSFLGKESFLKFTFRSFSKESESVAPDRGRTGEIIYKSYETCIAKVEWQKAEVFSEI